MIDITWHFLLAGESRVRPWEATTPPGDLSQLQPVRKAQTSNRNRHIPVKPWTATQRTSLELESGHEHDLVRKLDRLPEVTALIPQPAKITWIEEHKTRTHIPDLLSVTRDEKVTIWDVRPPEKQDENFHRQVVISAQACKLFGWRHRVFEGQSTAERLNHMWLNGFRTQPNWIEPNRHILEEAFDGAETRTVGELFSLDKGDGEIKSVMWHLLWKGQLRCDLSCRITQMTEIELTGYKS